MSDTEEEEEYVGDDRWGLVADVPMAASEAAADDDDEGWTLEDMTKDSEELDGEVPSLNALRKLVREYHRRWIGREDVHSLSCLGEWVWEQLGISKDKREWRDFQGAIANEIKILRRLDYLMRKVHNVEGGEMYDSLADVSRLFTSMQRFAREQARIYCLMDPGNEARKLALPVDNDDDKRKGDNQSIFDYDEKDLKSWQNFFLFLREELIVNNYRRADGKFFVRYKTPSNLLTLAFKEHITVEDFVANNTPYMTDFKAWRWMTDAGVNFRQMVEYMTHRPLAEAPDLRENCHLRSYAGDAFGRGAVVYDCGQDMAWPYVDRQYWEEMAKQVTLVRRVLLQDPTYECTPPKPDDVCCVHLEDNVFPYDICKELRDIDPSKLGLCWREAGEYECPAREEVDAPELAKLLHDRIPIVWTSRAKDAEIQSAFEEGLWGRSWVQVESLSDEQLSSLVEVEGMDETLREHIARGQKDVSDEMLRTHLAPGTKLDASSCVRAGHRVFLPCYTPPRRVRAVLTKGEWDGVASFDESVPPRCFVRHKVSPFLRWEVCEKPSWWEGGGNGDPRALSHEGLSSRLRTSATFATEEEWTRLGVTGATTESVVRTVRCRPGKEEDDEWEEVFYTPGKARWRYFRPHLGRTWLDCAADDVEHIYDCQDFTEHDKFMLFACMGRLFFHVGERDQHQMTLMIEGVGGCGKSTIMQLQQSFWPPHLRGILSSNMQPQFGMSDVAEKEVIFCNEVSGELQVVQEEWQTSVSGEWGSYAVKNEKPLVVKWKGQHFWVGNSFPTRFKNQQGQVTRRLAGVLMANPVKPRDGSILKTMFAERGALQRKEVLAYQEFVRLTGGIDPMSVPEKLPPAFESYYRKGRAKTNPFEEFLDLGEYVVKEEGGMMLMNDLKTLFNQYRLANDMGKATRWSEDIYRTAFSERGITWSKRPFTDEQGTQHTNATVICNLRPAAP